MALSISVKSDAPRALRRLKDQLLRRSPRAAAAGINRTAQAARTAAIRAIQLDVGTSSQKTIRRHVYVSRATPQRLTAKLQARSTKKHRIPIFEIRPRPRTVTGRRPAGGVKYGPRQKLLAGSFIARMKSGHVGVFKRLGQRRTPIAELFGPSVALVLARRRVY